VQKEEAPILNRLQYIKKRWAPWARWTKADRQAAEYVRRGFSRG
jgi:hypothetical protein